jgi:molybdopterin synthase catalytic subunit
MLSVQDADFDVAALYAQLRAAADNAGAIVSFTGLVREFYESSEAGREPAVQRLVLEHYPGMTQKALLAIVDEARARWDVLAWQVIHRVGPLEAGDQIVYVGIASTHRGDAFAAAEFIMDYLKTRAPFWKKQHTANGAHWIESRSADEAARARWEKR